MPTKVQPILKETKRVGNDILPRTPWVALAPHQYSKPGFDLTIHSLLPKIEEKQT
jgi:hypothetical protein